LWGLGWGGWYRMHETDPIEAEAMLGWWYVHTGQHEAATAARKPPAPQQPRKRTGRRVAPARGR